MEERIDLLLYDKSNNLIEEINIKKPQSYSGLLNTIKATMKKLPKYYNINCQKDNQSVIINNDEQYKFVKHILFIHEVNNLEESVFSSNYNKLTASKKQILDDKYCCSICKENIKDKQLICYQCQKIFHKKCLEDWNEACKNRNINFNCPMCKYQLPIENWKEKVNYKEERNNEAKRIYELNRTKFKENTNNSNIYDKKYNDLKNEFKKYVDSISHIFKSIFIKMSEINSLINYNNNINNIKFNNPNEMYNKIIGNLEIIKNFVKAKITKSNIISENNQNKFNLYNRLNSINQNEINCIYVPKDNETEINLLHDYNNESIWIGECKKKYLQAKKEIYKNISEENIELYVNDIKMKFGFRLKVNNSREIKVKFKFKTKLTTTSYMFYKCSSLKSIDLSSFNTSNVTDMGYMFSNCSSLESINLSSLNTTNVTDMSCLFSNCSSLKLVDLSSFNTTHVTDMRNIFYQCSSLKSIDLSSFNTTNVINMSYMFSECSSLEKKNIKIRNQDNKILEQINKDIRH